MTQLGWNHNRQQYEAQAEIDGKERQIVVDGDVFAEEKRDRAWALLQERYPDQDHKSDEWYDFTTKPEQDWAWQQAFNELIDVAAWIASAPMHGVYVDGEPYV